MKGGFGFVLAAMLFSIHADAMAASVSSQWILEDIARKTGTSPCFVRQALGENFFIAAQQYDMSRTSRERIRRLVREYRDVLLAERSAGTTPSSLLDSCNESQAMEKSRIGLNDLLGAESIPAAAGRFQMSIGES